MLVRKKALEDSISLAHNAESYYRAKASDAIKTSADTAVWQRLVDSSTAQWSLGKTQEKELQAVEFSIDSLSKMK